MIALAQHRLDQTPMTKPDYAVPPGLFLQEFIDDGDFSKDHAAQTLNLSHTELNDLLTGRIRINEGLAEKLETLTGTSAKAWLTLEKVYHTELVRLAAIKSLSTKPAYPPPEDWFAWFPVRVSTGDGKGKLVWLKTIQRIKCPIDIHNYDLLDPHYLYQFKDTDSQ